MRGHAADVDAVELNVPRLVTDQSGNRTQQRRLAGAVAAQNGDDLPRSYGQRGSVEDATGP
jgi:hypothetical protein